MDQQSSIETLEKLNSIAEPRRSMTGRNPNQDDYYYNGGNPDYDVYYRNQSQPKLLLPKRDSQTEIPNRTIFYTDPVPEVYTNNSFLPMIDEQPYPPKMAQNGGKDFHSPINMARTSIQDHLIVGNKFLDNRRQSFDQTMKSFKGKMRKLSTQLDPHDLRKRLYRKKKTKPTIWDKKPWLFNLIMAIICFLVALWAFATFGNTVFEGFTKELELKEGGEITKAWKTLPVPVRSQYYLFSIENPRKFLKGAKPILKEHGPYNYEEYITKKVLEYLDQTVVYTERTHFVFQQKNSADRKEKFYVINYPLVSILFTIQAALQSFSIQFLSPIVQEACATVFRLSGEKIIEKRNAFEVLEGRPIDLIVVLDRFVKPLKDFGIPLPDLDELGEGSNKLRNQTYGFIWQRADQDSGPYENYRRTENGHLFNSVYKVYESTTLPRYRAPCNKIGGSDGMHHGLKLHEKWNDIQVFNPNACRRLNFKRNMTKITRGITTIEYRLDPRIFDMKVRANRCFCLQPSLAQCNGWSEISPCTAGIPLGISWPHFLRSPTLAAKVNGLKPDPNLHDSYINVEPHTGMTIQAKIGIQINIMLSNTLPGMQGIRDMIMPVMWTCQIAGPGDSDVLLFRVLVFLIEHGNVFVGSIFAVLGNWNIYRAYKKSKQSTKPM